MDNTEENKVLTVEEVAKLLRVTDRTIRYMIRKGELPAAKVGKEYRILQAEVDKLFTQRTQEAQS